MSPKNINGFILVSVLLFLTIITFLFIFMNESCWFTVNMNNNIADHTYLFYATETKLATIENHLINKHSCEDYEILYASCGIQICHVEVSTEYKNTTTTLHSSLAIIDDTAICPISPQEKEGRLAWWI